MNQSGTNKTNQNEHEAQSIEEINMTSDDYIFCTFLFAIGFAIAIRWGWILGQYALVKKHNIELAQVICRLNKILEKSK